MSIRTEHSSLRQGLVGCWVPSLGASGFLLPNRARQSNNATHNGAITAAPGGTTLDLSGTQFADLGSAATLYPSLTSVTWSGWVRMRSFTNAYGSLQETQTTSDLNTNYQFSPFIKSNGKLACYVCNGSYVNQSGYDGTGAFTLAANTWYHLVFTYIASVSISAWVNGVFDGSLNSGVVSTIQAAVGPVQISRSVIGTRFINGQLDDIRIYSRALTLSEIRLLASRRGIGLTRLPDRAAGLPRKLSVNVGGDWRAADAYVNVGGVWKLGQASVNVAGTWR